MHVCSPAEELREIAASIDNEEVKKRLLKIAQKVEFWEQMMGRHIQDNYKIQEE